MRGVVAPLIATMHAHPYMRAAHWSATLPQHPSQHSREKVHQTVLSSLHLTPSLPARSLHEAGSSRTYCPCSESLRSSENTVGISVPWHYQEGLQPHHSGAWEWIFERSKLFPSCLAFSYQEMPKPYSVLLQYSPLQHVIACFPILRLSLNFPYPALQWEHHKKHTELSHTGCLDTDVWLYFSYLTWTCGRPGSNTLLQLMSRQL